MTDDDKLVHPNGVVAHVIVTDPQAHRDLIALCQKWHCKKKNSMYIDSEGSLSGYREEQTLRRKRP